ncbi:hypothetical protein HDV05_006068 [Chytridiales sp. JEL 0842]|nr:hypothetical protein HDV05_006068 [Chytridiales sp. JEL 0842]
MHSNVDFLSVSFPGLVRVYYLVSDKIMQVAEIQLDLKGRLGIAWAKLSDENGKQMLAVYNKDCAKVYMISADNEPQFVADFEPQIKGGLEKCIFSTVTDSLIHLFGRGILTSHSLSQTQESKSYSLPLNTSAVRSALSIPTSGSTPVGDETMVLAFEMPEGNIYEDFDILALRGWRDVDLSASIRAVEKKNVDVELSSSLKDRLVSIGKPQGGEPLAKFTQMDIPAEKRALRTAGSVLLLIRLDVAKGTVQVLGRQEMPILMPDVLVYDEDRATVIVANNSISTFLSYKISQRHPQQALQKLSPIRLDPSTTILGATIIPASSSSQLVLLLGAGPRDSASKSFGFAPKSVAEKALKLGIYTATETNKTISTRVEYEDSEMRLAQTVLRNDEKEDDEGPELRLGELKLPDFQERVGGSFRRGMIQLVQSHTEKLLLEESNNIEDVGVGERLNRIEDKLDRMMKMFEQRLSGIESRQEEILRALAGKMNV